MKKKNSVCARVVNVIDSFDPPHIVAFAILTHYHPFFSKFLSFKITTEGRKRGTRENLRKATSQTRLIQVVTSKHECKAESLVFFGKLAVFLIFCVKSSGWGAKYGRNGLVDSSQD